MFENEEALKQRLAKNICFYRELAGDTQLELAEKLNYSDKSVSKWERGEGLPSIFVLTSIAECYGITVNDLLAEQPKKPRRISRHNYLIVTLLSFGLVWLVATIVFVVLKLAAPDFPGWYAFLFAVPVNAIVSIVFTCLWWQKITRFLSISTLIWSSFVCLITVIPIHNSSVNLFYIVAGILQVMVVLWFMLRKNKGPKPVVQEDQSSQ